MKSTDSVIVSWDFSRGKDVGVLIVGSQKNGRVDVINCKDWMLVEETDFYYRIINKNTGVIKSVDKFRRVRRRK